MICLWAQISLMLFWLCAAAFLVAHRCSRRTHIRTRALLAVVCLLCLAGLMLIPPARAVYVYEYGLTGAPNPWGIAVDKSGNVWITEQGANKIAKVGSPTYELSIPTPGSVPWGIAASKDHEDIWFTEETAGKIGRFIPSQNWFYEFALPDSASARPRGITMNVTKMADGKVPRYDVWFTEYGRNRIGHLYSTDGVTVRFSFYAIPGVLDAQPLCIAMSPIDYSIWFTEYKGDRISCIRLLENGTALFKHYATSSGSGLWGIGVDPDGFVWVTESKRSCIGRLNPISGEYVTFAIPTPSSEPHELVVEAVTTSTPYRVLNVWFTEYGGNKIGRYDPGLNAFFEYSIISGGGRPHGIAMSGAYGYVWFTEPFVQKVGAIYGWHAPPRVTTTTVGTMTSAVTTGQTLLPARSAVTTSAVTTTVAGAVWGAYGYASATVVTATYTFTSSKFQLTSTSVYSYTRTSGSTSYTTTTTTTTATQVIVMTSTLSTSTSTAATATSWYVQTSTQPTSRTSTSTVYLTSLTTTTTTDTSTTIYPTVTLTSMNASYLTSTTFSPTITVTYIQTSVAPATSTATSMITTSVTTTTTAAITRPCVIASAAYGSELAPQVQFLREFRDGTVMSTFAGSQFMRVFNSFYYSFSPAVAQATLGHHVLKTAVRTAIYPLILCLEVSSLLYDSASFNPELSSLLTGLLASGLIGAIYVTPLLAIVEVFRKRSGKRDV